jgi:tRNA G46 methylase TrmB
MVSDQLPIWVGSTTVAALLDVLSLRGKVHMATDNDSYRSLTASHLGSDTEVR